MVDKKWIFFDFDGTLLPMDQDVFANTYFQALGDYLVPYGYDKTSLIQAVWAGTKAMVMNDGRKTNMEVFWDTFSGILGSDVRKDMPVFERFYAEEFVKARKVCGIHPEAGKLIEDLHHKGYRLVLATNPIFPRTATMQRIAWAGINADLFEEITTYEDYSYSKPSLKYYEELAEKLGIDPAGCIMIGNDAVEDLAAIRLGMQVYLVTDDLINTRNVDLQDYPHGAFSELRSWLKLDEEISDEDLQQI